MASTEKKTVHGGCHCGNIKYTADIKVDEETGAFSANRCNCTFCQKLGTTNCHLESSSDFKLLSPGSKDELSDYAPRVKSVHRYFCKDCGTHVWMEGYYEFSGQKHHLFVINLATVDQPQEGIDLSQTKIKYFDMLNENFTGGLKDQPWPNGLL